MTYRHSLHEYYEHLAVQHTNETVLASGLIAVQHLAITDVHFDPHTKVDGLLVDSSMTEMDPSGIIDPSTEVESVVGIEHDVLTDVIGKRTEALGSFTGLSLYLSNALTPETELAITRLHAQINRAFVIRSAPQPSNSNEGNYL